MYTRRRDTEIPTEEKRERKLKERINKVKKKKIEYKEVWYI